MKKYKAIITDIDGTLIPNRKDGEISLPTLEAIRSIVGKIHFGVATSRDMVDIERFVEPLSLSGPSIIYGGAWIVDPSTHTVLKEQNMNLDEFQEAYTIAQNLAIPFVINDGGIKYKSHDSSYKALKPITIWGHGLTDQQLGEFLQQTSHLSTLTTHAIPSWQDGKIDFISSHTLATKQHAILEVTKLLDITPDEIIGIGDGANDIPLLMTCGLKVAVGNAVDSLKEIADYIAPSVEDHAIADVIAKFIL